MLSSYILHMSSCVCLQAFALPVLQIVHETLQAWARGAAVTSSHAEGNAAISN
jgi:hypothetical protein